MRATLHRGYEYSTGVLASPLVSITPGVNSYCLRLEYQLDRADFTGSLNVYIIDADVWYGGARVWRATTRGKLHQDVVNVTVPSDWTQIKLLLQASIGNFKSNGVILTEVQFTPGLCPPSNTTTCE